MIVAKLLCAACVVYLGIASPVRAQDFGLASVLKFAATARHNQMVESAFARLSPDVFQRCAGLVSKGSHVAIVQPVSVAANGQPNAGTWKESFPVSGCGNDTTFHIYFFATADKINTFVSAPGDTRADPVLQKDALLYVMLGASTFAKTCKTFNIKTTKFDGADSVANKVRSWRETWTMVGCHRTLDVPVQFNLVDTGGTDIVQRLNDVVERP